MTEDKFEHEKRCLSIRAEHARLTVALIDLEIEIIAAIERIEAEDGSTPASKKVIAQLEVSICEHNLKLAKLNSRILENEIRSEELHKGMVATPLLYAEALIKLFSTAGQPFETMDPFFTRDPFDFLDFGFNPDGAEFRQ